MASNESPDPTVVRSAKIGDASDVARLLDQLGYPCNRDEAADRIVTVLGDPRQHLLIAERDGHACGLISLNMVYSVAHGADLARITALIVGDDCQREGIGRRLLREVEVLSRQAGVSRIEVTSGPQRQGAHAFYRGCGYSEGSLRFVKLLGD
ncbi:GNAT family N-acetyltransferase [Lysobacter korlensis]|uniref:GNAT family N-acetyltransferase n=1 Tax=Lysobacter korlensis TaxID=553636 RepID=A0ABV6RIN6_9GAMM